MAEKDKKKKIKDQKTDAETSDKPKPSTNPFKPSQGAVVEGTEARGTITEDDVEEGDVEEGFFNGKDNSPQTKESGKTIEGTSPKDSLLGKLSEMEQRHGFEFGNKERTVNYFMDNVLPARRFPQGATTYFAAALDKVAGLNPRAAQRLFETLPDMYALQLSDKQIEQWTERGLRGLEIYNNIPKAEQTPEELTDCLNYFDLKNEDTEREVHRMNEGAAHKTRKNFKYLTAAAVLTAVLAAGGLTAYFVKSSGAQAELAAKDGKISDLEGELSQQPNKAEYNPDSTKVDYDGDGKDDGTINELIGAYQEATQGRRCTQLKEALKKDDFEGVKGLVEDYLRSVEGEVMILKGGKGALFDAICDDEQGSADYQPARTKFVSGSEVIEPGKNLCTPGKYTCFGVVAEE